MVGGLRVLFQPQWFYSANSLLTGGIPVGSTKSLFPSRACSDSSPHLSCHSMSYTRENCLRRCLKDKSHPTFSPAEHLNTTQAPWEVHER